MYRRANMASGKGKRRIYSSKYALSSIVYCPKCGDIYRRIAWNNRVKQSIVWRCVTRVEHGPSKCDAPTIEETDLQNAVVKAINMALGGKDDMLVALEQNIASVLALEDEGSMESINTELEKLQKELLKQANAKEDYNDIADEIDRLRELKQNAMAENAEREGLKQRIAEIQEFLAEQMEQIEEYDESLVRRMVEKLTVMRKSSQWNSSRVQAWMWRDKRHDCFELEFGILIYDDSLFIFNLMSKGQTAKWWNFGCYSN